MQYHIILYYSLRSSGRSGQSRAASTEYELAVYAMKKGTDYYYDYLYD